jgi:predicted nuclease of predicted toxin-antitoxin system
MRLLANENVPRAAVSTLAAAGHDIVWIRTVAPGATDAEVLALAAREQRILLTFDKDFGELARASGLPRNSGIVLFCLTQAKRGGTLLKSSRLGQIGPGIFRL